MNSQSPRYTEVAPNGQIIRQAPTVPPELAANLDSQPSMSYNVPSPNGQWSNYPYQPSQPKNWWQNFGPFNPYRTTYQDYGQRKNQQNATSNVFYTQSSPHTQNTPGNFVVWNSYGGQGSMNYETPRHSQAM